MLSGIILAAGQGRRMGSFPKALLKIENKTFLETISGNMFLAGLTDVYIVLGYYSDRIRAEVEFKREIILENPEPDRGQLSSLHVAINSMAEYVRAVMVTLVDLPKVRVSTYEKLFSQWKLNREKIYVCTCGGKRGHPVIFPGKYFSELLNTPLELGARAVVRSHADELVCFEVDDPGICNDIDTVEDYEHMGYY